MNWIRIIQYCFILVIAQIVLSTLLSVLWGVDYYSPKSLNELLIYQKLPSALLSIFILTIYAKQQVNRTILHLALSFSACSLLSLTVTLLLLGELFISPMWMINFPIDVITVLASFYLGKSFRHINKEAAQ
ncbi:hypothetical protein BCU84_04700 [Shewanella sp. 10N.286.51.B7]|uniref:hypothetical protein n=1 Tax=Shewanella sp. 10N.286.51.B7 TaxID=1880836 RepID=UPI000C825D65|nr:hypothetical protein [Shewanella sp. 10N.286.51.B7]PMG80043.1 hypothetical protein BCU84_04700 [Shewanella sp. 10N.286.51.B7]